MLIPHLVSKTGIGPAVQQRSHDYLVAVPRRQHQRCQLALCDAGYGLRSILSLAFGEGLPLRGGERLIAQTPCHAYTLS